MHTYMLFEPEYVAYPYPWERCGQRLSATMILSNRHVSYEYDYPWLAGKCQDAETDWGHKQKTASAPARRSLCTAQAASAELQPPDGLKRRDPVSHMLILRSRY